MGYFEFFLTADFWFSILRIATPVVFATLAANIAWQCGVFNIGIEGTMLACGLTGVLVSAFVGGNTVVGLIAGMFAGMFMGMIFGWLLGLFALRLKAHIIISGLALNLLGSGGTVFAMWTILGERGVSSRVISAVFPSVNLPVFSWIPGVGQFLNDVLLGHNILTYVAILFAIGMWVLLYKTPLGLKIRAVGENREAAESVGIKVGRIQFFALTISGLMASFAGMVLSMGILSLFNAGQAAGRGMLAIATNAMAGSNPILGFFASLIFGFFGAIDNFFATVSQRFAFVFRASPFIMIIILYAIYSFVQKKKNKEEFEF
ncbi:MAG: ABC transporter permease [Oscillospiraceae bacterium]|nr:ABC transporter permease [Oscillospiraceae bacterium]